MYVKCAIVTIGLLSIIGVQSLCRTTKFSRRRPSNVADVAKQIKCYCAFMGPALEQIYLSATFLLQYLTKAYGPIGLDFTKD